MRVVGPVPGMIHTNGNLLCAVDCETTSLDHDKCEILELAILPLDICLNIAPEVSPFHIFMRPDFPEDINPESLAVSKTSLTEIMKMGVSQDEGTDLFYTWFDSLKMPLNRKIMPLGHNFANFDKPVLQKWLSPKGYDHYFHWHIRDTLIAALYQNDRAYFQMQAHPFSELNLTHICRALNISRKDAHSALGDCISVQKVYREMMLTVLGMNPEAKLDTEQPEKTFNS